MLLDPLQARKLYEFAIKEKFAILAVNADSPACIYDCIKAAKQLASPIIIEASLWQLEGQSFGAGDAIRGLAHYIAHTALIANSQKFKDVPVLFHTDHIKGPKTKNILENAVKGVAVSLGGVDLKLSPSSISLDASEISNKENIDFLNNLISISKKYGRPLTLEMEAGVDKGISSLEQAKILTSGVETKNPGYLYLYAPGLGTQHGFSKNGYSEFQPKKVAENIRVIEETIGRRIGIAVHGSSGLSEKQLKTAIENGVTKVNWSTENLILRSQFAREYYEKNVEKLTPGNKEFKVTAMDNGVNHYISKNYIPKVMARIKLQSGQNKNTLFWGQTPNFQ